MVKENFVQKSANVDSRCVLEVHIITYSKNGDPAGGLSSEDRSR